MSTYTECFPTAGVDALEAPNRADYEHIAFVVGLMHKIAKASSTRRQRRYQPFPDVTPLPGAIATQGIGIVYRYGKSAALLTCFGRIELPQYTHGDVEAPGLEYRHGSKAIATSLVHPSWSRESGVSRGDVFGPYRQVDEIYSRSGRLVIPSCTLLEVTGQELRDLTQERYQQWVALGGAPQNEL